MTSYQNREVKKYFVFAVIFSLAAAIVTGMVVMSACNHYRREENRAIQALLAEALRQNPKTDLREFLDILNGEKTVGDGNNLRNGRESEVSPGMEQAIFFGMGEISRELSRYGITEDSYFIAGMKPAQNRIVVCSVVGILLAEGILLLCFGRYLRRRQEQLNLLSGYMDRIVLGQYDLDLKDNTEDELSNLKNQLFKITLTMREQARESKEQKKALAESVSDISHQLKTPLTSASILLDNLTDSPDMDGETRERFIREVAKQIHSMKWMILSMLKLSRLDAGVVEFEEQSFSLDKMLREAAENLEMIAELKEVTVVLPGKDENFAENRRITVCGDYNWNREAFLNVLKNAIEHSPQGERVLVETEDNEVYTAITVTNFGKEISPEEQQRIFVRHYSSANASENNMGIGLPLAKAILERQNGYLTVDSGEGKTSFTLKYLKIGKGIA